ncbi:GAF domain-containing protein [Microseira sp. BLCC-F43]|jgi:light-regulated signal transduction histidine kinase (bacteriophytochrome)|uniref:GAF domain-containing sensor histidine kinase n=1 Tax=Microseira sp. BLCC-F43 TaxID=3153602 RepID=UPI0035BA6DD9
MNLTGKNQEMQPGINQETLLHRMTNRIRQSLELQEILTSTVAEIRDFLATDRVMVYRFNNDSSGEVIAESIDGNRLPSLKGLNFPADDIPPEARQMFLLARQRTIVDVTTQQIGLSRLDCPETGTPHAPEHIWYRSVDPCHAAYLTAMGVQSSFIVPILHYDIGNAQAKPQLWGLLVSHHSEQRRISEAEVEVVQRVVDQVSIAIAQSNLLSSTRSRATREATVNRVATLLHDCPTIEFQAALQATVAVFGGAGGRLYIQAPATHPEVVKSTEVEVYTWGEGPDLAKLGLGEPIEQHPDWQEVSGYCATAKRGIRPSAIADLYKVARCDRLAPSFADTQIRGLLVVPLEYRQQFLGYLSIFRKEIDTETLWAGQFDPDARQQFPRLSFEAWRQLKKGQAREWTQEEIELATALGYQFAMAVQQYQLYQQVQRLNSNLELLVQKRTAQLQQSLDFAKVLKQVTDQIRSTLESKTILQTIVREVRALLDTDRVLIYQFTAETQGEVVVEAIAGNWPSVLGVKAPKDCFPPEYVPSYKNGRVGTIEDTANANIAACHSEFLQSIQVQADLIVPIKRGEDLWGLLIAHSCRAPRVWTAAEIEVLQQLADQAAIAILQAELYEQSRDLALKEQAKAQQLEAALDELQHTQSQLIQTEKMSSLGQLVAGVAHEINNPVNFIFGNINYASEYTQDLLDLLHLYQKYYPEPHPEICDRIEEIELDFLEEDLIKLLASMKVGTDRIRQLVLSLRNFSRLDESERKPVDIHEGIESTLLILQHRLKPKAGHPGIQIIKDYGNLPPVECYASQLNQVFMNILSNAIDALEQSAISSRSYSVEGQKTATPKIQISTEVIDREKVRICIADNGSGMPPHVQARIFDPFFTTKPVGQGTGLGLAISYQIVVEKHKGLLQCLSQPGRGTQFQIEIPLRASVLASTGNRQSAGEQVSG